MDHFWLHHYNLTIKISWTNLLFINFVIWFLLNHLVQPKIQQIRVIPDGPLYEEKTNFSIICNISANYSRIVEFLFRSDESKRFESLANISSAEESLFTWVAILYRERKRESNGEYLCHLFGDNNTNFKIPANIICIICNVYFCS